MKSLKRRQSKRLCTIIRYITGHLNIDINSKTTGKELFMDVCKCLGIKQYEYFGLQYEGKKKSIRWLRPGKKVYQIVGNSQVPLYFLVKYFPEDIEKINDNTAISLIYNQCKKEIVTGTLFCPPETSILLASYVLQSELGDWPHVDGNLFDPMTLIPKSVLSRYSMSPEAWAHSLGDWHKDHEGLTPAEAQIEYLKVAQHLGMYGVSYFKAKSEGRIIWIGIHPKGINIYDNTLLIPTMVLKWVFIKMVQYSFKKFIVSTVLENVRDYIFHLKNMRTARLVLELSLGYHHLHVHNRYLPSKMLLINESEREKFKETTEEFYSIATKSPPSWRKIRTQKPSFYQLPTLKEEERSD